MGNSEPCFAMIATLTSFTKFANFTSINIFTCWSGLEPDLFERVLVRKDWDWSPMPMQVVRMSIVFTPALLSAAAVRTISPPPILAAKPYFRGAVSTRSVT